MIKHIFITFLSLALFQGFLFAKVDFEPLILVEPNNAPDSNTSQSSISDAYQDEDVLISFNRTYSKTGSNGDEFFIELKLKILANNKIVGCYRSSFLDGGIEVLDNFGNNLDCTAIDPLFYSGLKLRPGEEKLFAIKFSLKPLENTEYLLLKIPRRVFGNINPFERKIVKPVFEPQSKIESFEDIKPTIPPPPEGFTEDVTPTLEPVETLPQENPIWQIAVISLIGIAICLVLFLIYKYIFKNVLRMISSLKRKYPADWRTILSVWIACVAFLMLSLFCLIRIMDMDEDGMSAPFIIGSLSIAAVLATVLFSIKKMKGE